MMTEKEIAIFKYNAWRQKIHLRDNYYTPGRIEDTLWDFIGLPKSLNEKSFLDIGANDGMFSFLAEKKGATEVTASDLYIDKLDTMQNGWPLEGILLLKDYFQSKIKLHHKGIYFLSELQKQYDVVFVNNIINWLDNIDLAFENIGKATKGTLYLSDGFITDNKSPKQVEQENSNLRYMYNLSFIEKLLNKNGFKIEKVRELNYQKMFLKKFSQTPELHISKETKIYDYPSVNSNKKNTDKPIVTPSYGALNDFFHVANLGWVQKSDVSVKYYPASKAYEIAKRLNLEKLYYKFLSYRHSRNTKIKSYVIIASKIK